MGLDTADPGPTLTEGLHGTKRAVVSTELPPGTSPICQGSRGQVDAQRCPRLPEVPQPRLSTPGCGAPWPGPAWPSPLRQGLGGHGAVALHPHRVTAWLHWPQGSCGDLSPTVGRGRGAEVGGGPMHESEK